MDALARTSMKAVVNCNNHYDLQNSVKQLVVECGMCFWALPKSESLSCFAFVHWIIPLLKQPSLRWQLGCCCHGCVQHLCILVAYEWQSSDSFSCVAIKHDVRYADLLNLSI